MVIHLMLPNIRWLLDAILHPVVSFELTKIRHAVFDSASVLLVVLARIVLSVAGVCF